VARLAARTNRAAVAAMNIPPMPGILGASGGSRGPIQFHRVKPGGRAAGADADLRELGSRVVHLRSALDGLRRAFESQRSVDRRVEGRAAIARSARPLELALASSATTLASSSAIEATTTSFVAGSGDFSGSSTSRVKIGGTYSGSLGDTTLTFQVTKGGSVGTSSIELDVRKSDGTLVETVVFEQGEPAGTVKTLSSGLTLSLSAGTAKKDETFQVQISSSTPTLVNPDQPFSGSGGSPYFLNGSSVRAGTLEINGAQIAVNANDTIGTLLERISASSAGVNASFDPDAQRVVLTQKTKGSSGAIVLGADTSGFFAAVSLADATPAPGVDSDLDRPVAEVAALAGIRSGSFKINGVSIAVDAEVDSLRAIVARINSSGAGAEAGYDAGTRKLVIVSDSADQALVLEDGTSAFLAAVGVAEGTRKPSREKHVVETGRRGFRSLRVYESLVEVAAALDSIFSGSFGAAAKPAAEKAVQGLREAIASAFESGRAPEDGLESGLGLDFSFEEPDKGVARIDARGFFDAAQSRRQDQARFFLADERRQGRGGLIDSLASALDGIDKDLMEALGTSGFTGLALDLQA
jgi:hypothetical protein